MSTVASSLRSWRKGKRVLLSMHFGPPLPEAVKKFNGRDALLRVRDAKPKTDAGHRVPTESGLRVQTNFFHPSPALGRAEPMLAAGILI